VAVVDEDGTLHPLPGVRSLTGLLAGAGGLPGLLDMGAASLDVPAGPHVREVRLLAPLQPPTVRDFVIFEEHVAGVRRSVDGSAGVPEQWYAAPTFSFTNPYAVYGPHDDIPVPPGSAALDFELEVAAVIGMQGLDLTPEQAREHIVGYTVFNDWSAPGHRRRAGEVPRRGRVPAARSHRRRERRGRRHRPAVPHELDLREMVAYASRGTWVRPGGVLSWGTCGNGGCLAELWGLCGRRDPPPLKPGDTVTLTVEGIGSVINTVVAGTDPVPVPPAGRRTRERS
jgi:2-keto-4-pentenoate hydratase/2-oxohepta-3-ene-1,7-dioic acid hydratase in catechol pathway